MNVNRKSFNMFCQFVMFFARDELTIELLIKGCSLRPKKLFLFVSLNFLDDILLHFFFTGCLASSFSDLISFIVQSCLTVLIRYQFM